jgi:hypothetical protein
MRDFVDQELFNMCAVTAAKISCHDGQTTFSAAELIAAEYGRSYQDNDLTAEVNDAAIQVSQFLADALPNGSLASACTQMQFCIKHFKLDGKRKRKKILGGVWFSGENQEISNKVDKCIANIATYHFLVIGGTIPIAPKGWSM